MAIYKCKMCGGTIEFEQGATVGVCDSCGTKQTLPRLDDDRRANLYDRANHFRRNNDFDKAAGMYEQILNEDRTDAEAYWSLVLCQYGIEYVEDPATHKRVPTVNRAQFTSIFDDDNYKSAIQYADGYQRELYEKEAKAINDIQKGILAISQKEEPFDVFICYKETDHNGRRTPDSVLANDLYYQLKQEGFKVFFARITLEDKLGTAYEPYIFAALNSAKVMVVLGTKPEHFNAVWVKNEWSRYLALVKHSGGKKILIPAYRDMDPYDLPEEFSHLQAQDMSKLGFMQDLIRGIKKIIPADAPATVVKETVVANQSNAATAPLLERVFLFLEDGKWQDANIYCEKVLDIDPKNANAYLGKLMVELQVRNRKQLADCAEPFNDSGNYVKVLRFGDEALENEMRGYIQHINDRNETARLTDIYNGAVNAMNTATTENAYKEAANTFQSISGFRDADELAETCLDKAEICRKDAIYLSAKAQMNGNKVAHYREAIKIFQTISGWKDADEQICFCQKQIEKLKAKAEADRLEAERKAEERRIAAEKAAKKIKKAFAIGTPVVCVCIAFFIILTTVIIPKLKYNKAMSLLDSGNYDAGYALLEEIGNNDAITSNKYDRAMKLIDAGDYDSAYILLEEIGKNDVITSNKYDRAMKLIDAGDYDSGYALLKEIGNDDTITSNKYDRAMKLIDTGNYDTGYALLKEIGRNDAITSNKYNRAVDLMEAGNYTEAISMFRSLNGYKDSVTQIEKCNAAIKDEKYDRAVDLMEAGNYTEAFTMFQSLNGYKDSIGKAADCLFPKQKAGLTNVKVGSTIKFGSYEQDNKTSNGKEEIEWKVLAIEGNKALVVSQYALDCQPYNNTRTDTTWETCTLRTWLNETFYNEAFGTDHQKMIVRSTVSADTNPQYSTNPGNATNDKVFLLSIKEAEKYFSTDSARRCQGTAYCYAQGAYKVNNGNCLWWLRSPGCSQDYAAYVLYDGDVYVFGYYVDIDGSAVRPALWIDLTV